MNCSHICKSLYKRLLVEDITGVVHSVFDNSINILDENHQLITFLSRKKPMSPNAIRLEGDISFQSLNIKVKQNIHFSRQTAEIQDLNLKFFYKKAEVWDKRPNLSFNKDDKENLFLKLREMEKTLYTLGNRGGIYLLVKSLEELIGGIEVLFDHDHTLGPRENFIKERFIGFIKAYIDNDLDNISQRARDIIGYGIGLTPSMDDFISGLMVSRIFLSYYLNLNLLDAYKINSLIIEKLEKKTTIVSEEMLRFSSLGQVNEYIGNFMVSLLGKSSMDMFIKDLEKVLTIGETSGTDTLLGIYIGSYIMLDKL